MPTCPPAALWRAARRTKITSVFTSPAGVVAVIDDDQGMRQAMRRVLETGGFVTEIFSTAEAFLATGAASRARCLVLDIQLPGMSGFDLHRHLLASGDAIPTVFVTAHEDLCSRGDVIKAGACCLVKPFPAETLVKAVTGSLAR